ncbi:MAG TPA: hypothetical protein VFG69_07745 [Nannocystaceae bacterium]|nr:hypothetical protein [Nannocystaceae bacterium]
MNDLAAALTALELELERGRLALDRAASPNREHVVLDDIRALLGALHHLIRRYNHIVNAADCNRP